MLCFEVICQVAKEYILIQNFYFISICKYFEESYCSCHQICVFLKDFIGVQLIYNVGLVSGIKQSKSFIYIHVSKSFQMIFPYRSLKSIGQSSLCYTVGLSYLFHIYYCVYLWTRIPQKKWSNLIINKIVQNAVLAYNLKSGRKILVGFQGKLFNITVIQVYAPTTDAKEADINQFYEDLEDLLELTHTKMSYSTQGAGMQKQKVKRYLK